MLTPLDIHNKEFKKGVLGYSQDEVDVFLDKVEQDFEKICKENVDLKNKINVLQEKINYYKGLEDTIQNALVVAQTTAQDVVSTSYKKGEVIVNEAEHKARVIIDQANQEVSKIHEEFNTIKKQMEIFKTRFKTLIQAQLEALTEETNNEI